MRQQMKDTSQSEEKRDYLKSYKIAVLTEKAIDEEIRLLRMERMNPQTRLDGFPHMSGYSDLSSYAAKLDELLRQLGEAMDSRISLRRDINRRIEAVGDETEKLILRLRYIHCKDFEEIAEELGYCSRHVQRLHGKALEDFEMT